MYGSETKFRIWIQDIADPDQHGNIRKTFPRSETIIADLKSNITNNLRSDPNRKYFFIQLRTVIRTRHNCQKHDDFSVSVRSVQYLCTVCGLDSFPEGSVLWEMLLLSVAAAAASLVQSP